MVDLRALYAAGYSPEKMRQLFAPDAGPHTRKPKVQELLNLTTARIRAGVNRNIRHARHWWTIDQACDVSDRTMSATALRGLKSKHPDPKELLKVVSDIGMSSLLRAQYDQDGRPRTDSSGNTVYKIDDAPLVEVIAPICQQYLNARHATLVTGRDQSPWMKYSPLIYSRKNHLKTSIFTSRAERMVHEMGYRSDFKQESLGALKYGYQFVFPLEPYYWERQKFMFESGVREVVVRSGIRNTFPHPSRTFFDLAHRMSTINTNTGMDHAGYWDLFRWGSVKNNRNFWLTDDQKKDNRIGFGLGIEDSSWSAYNQLYPMAMSFPSDVFANNSRSDKDRTDEAFRITYSNTDQGVVVSPLFQKIIPKEWDLFDYEYPVWFCFTMANADTPLLVEPYAYTPVRVATYQGDQNHWRPPSIVTDLVPFQDAIGNLLTQYLITVRRNLMNLIYYNRNSVKKEEIDNLMAQAAGLYMGPNLVPVDFQAAMVDSTTANISDQFKAVAFPVVDAISVVTAINTMLGIVERIIGFTSQEVGTTSQHIQTAEEIRVTNTFVNNRIALTDSGLDASVAAQKTQVYEAVMAYDDDVIMAEIADATELDRKQLQEMGVLIEEGPNRKVGVLADKEAISLASFSADRDGSRRTNDAQIATALMQFAQTVLSVPQMIEAMGVPAIVDAFNTVAQFAGLPPEARLRVPEGQQSGPQVQQQMVAQIQEIVTQVLGGQMQEIGAGLQKEVIEPIETALTSVADRTSKVEAAVAQILQVIQGQPIPGV